MKFFVFGKSRLVSLDGIKCSAVLALLFVCLSTPVFATNAIVLQADDCKKCHWAQLQMIAEGGGLHATALSCLDCHPQHLPQNKDTKVGCLHCHKGELHFEVGDCRHCHVNPHEPLVSLRDPLKPARKECLSCHGEVGERMAAAPSRHAELFCNRCHSQHKEIPTCLDCHCAHQQNQVAVDCLKCHSAHQPLQIIPTGYVPAKFCRPCHGSQTMDLAASKSLHSGISCVYCHKGVHPSVAKCQDCHGLPHSQDIHKQYRSCLECHGDAHRLISEQEQH